MRSASCALLFVTACSGVEADGDVVLDTGPIEIPPGVEIIYCWSFEVDASVDGAVVAFDSDAGLGVHHLAVFADNGLAPLPQGPCVFYDPAWDMIYTAGGGAGSLEFPPGVGLPIGTRRLVLQGHLINYTTDTTFDSMMEVSLRVSDDDGLAPAGLFLFGTHSLSIPAGAIDHPVSARCSNPPDVQFIHAFPHMHDRGRSIRLSEETDQGSTVLLESGWSLGSQVYLPFEPEFSAGDGELVLDCRYDNPGDRPIEYGPSATDEMCQMAIVAYPLSETVNCFGG
jgi:hypothetical protein